MKKYLLIGVVVLATSITGYSFYASASSGAKKPEPVQEQQVAAAEPQAEAVLPAEEFKEKKKQSSIEKAQAELSGWNKMSKAERVKLVEQKRAEKLQKSAAKWAKQSDDKKIESYEKNLKRRAMSKEEKAKAAKERLEQKCKGVDGDDDKGDE